MQTVSQVDDYGRSEQTVVVHRMNRFGALLDFGVLLLAGPSHDDAHIMVVKASVDVMVLVLLNGGSSPEFPLYPSAFAVLVVLPATVVSNVFWKVMVMDVFHMVKAYEFPLVIVCVY